MIDPEVHAIGTRAGVRWIVVHAGRAAVFDTESGARDYAQLLIARAAFGKTCPACDGLGWVGFSRPTED